MRSRVRVLANQLMEKPQYVHLCPENLKQVAVAFKDKELSVPTFDYFPDLSFEDTCKAFLIFNSINYCFFDQDGNRMARGKAHGSALASLAIVENWKELQDPTFLSHIDETYLLSEFFKAPASMLKERVAALREVGQFFLRNDDFTFEKFFAKYRNDAYVASQALPVHLPLWRDPFFKRAQLFVAMVYGKFRDLDVIKEDTLQDLTAFADYRVPQTLVWVGGLEYSGTLEADISYRKLIPSGSFKELEIRAATLVAADNILEHMKSVKKNPNLNAIHVDGLLWSAAKFPDLLPAGLVSGPQPEYHRTMSTDY